MNRLKIKYGTPEYVIKEDSKVVICYLPYSFEDWNKTLKVIAINTLPTEFCDNDFPPFYESRKIKAVAKCKGNDKFDVQIGKKIALAKAENKVEMKVLSILNTINNFFIESVFVMKQRMIDSQNNVKHNIEYISKF